MLIGIERKIFRKNLCGKRKNNKKYKKGLEIIFVLVYNVEDLGLISGKDIFFEKK